MSSQTTLPKRVKWLYSMGDLTTSAPLTLIQFYQLFFLTDVAGMSPLWAGTAILIGKLWDAVNDPLFGILSDRVESRYGRRRVFLLFGALPLGLTFLLQFFIPPFGETGTFIYYTAVIIVFDTVLTTVSVSYNALTPQLTDDYDERSSLNGHRMFFSILGSLIAVIFATALGLVFDDLRTQFLVLGIVIGLAAAIPSWIAYSVTAEYDHFEPIKDPMPFWEAIQATLAIRPFWMLMGLYLFSWTTASLMATVLVFFATYYMNVGDQANFFVLVSQLSAVAFLPFWVWMAQRFEKKRAFIWGSLSWIVVLAALASVRPDQLILTYILAGLSGAGISTAYLLPWAMIPDVVELDELRTGKRREGIFYAFASFAQKLATALAIWALGLALEQFGYNGALDVQPPEAVQAIRLSMGIVPAVLLTISVIFASQYTITRESHADMKEQLAGRLLD